MEVTFLTNEDEKRIIDTVSANSVRHTAQTLTETQKAQARENIGAVSAEDVVLKQNKVFEKIQSLLQLENLLLLFLSLT
mgnify:CR=1 FL=1